MQLRKGGGGKGGGEGERGKGRRGKGENRKGEMGERGGREVRGGNGG